MSERNLLPAWEVIIDVKLCIIKRQLNVSFLLAFTEVSHCLAQLAGSFPVCALIHWHFLSSFPCGRVSSDKRRMASLKSRKASLKTRETCHNKNQKMKTEEGTQRDVAPLKLSYTHQIWNIGLRLSIHPRTHKKRQWKPLSTTVESSSLVWFIFFYILLWWALFSIPIQKADNLERKVCQGDLHISYHATAGPWFLVCSRFQYFCFASLAYTAINKGFLFILKYVFSIVWELRKKLNDQSIIGDVTARSV